jgi:hypothetical protein
MLPNLFVIGAAKSGTTSLHHYLGQHPDIFMSPVKEPNFFAFAGTVPSFAGPPQSGAPSFVRDRLDREKYRFSVLERAAYERLFEQGSAKPVRGESSAAYLYFPDSARRIQQLVPDARIVAVLRNPVERAFSKYLQMRRDRAEPLDQFAAAVAAEAKRKAEGWAPTWLYMDRGFYSRQLKPYLELFERRQIHVILYEDLRHDPKGCLREIFAFLQVDPDIEVDTGQHHNVSAVAEVPRFALLYQMIARPFLLSPRLQSLLPQGVASSIRPLARRLLLKPSAKTPAPCLPAELRTALTQEVRADVEQLQRLIGRDLSHWLDPAPPLGVRAAAPPGKEPGGPPGKKPDGASQMSGHVGSVSW